MEEGRGQIWRIEMLGGLRISCAGRTVEKFPTQKTAALLAYLATFPRSSHAREVLADLFWPDADPESQRHSLRLALSRLRTVFGPDHPLEAGRLTVRLNKDRFVTDVAEFEGAIARGDGTVAKRLYAGSFLPGFYDDWVLNEQIRLELLLEEVGDGVSTLPATLPRELGPFFGRKNEIASITELIKTGRVVTLTGPGGIGKSRLAIAVAKKHGRGVWVPFADLSNAGQAADAIREALHLPVPSPGFAVEDMIARELSDIAPILLVLDNLEHIASPKLTALISGLEGIKEVGILVTSRKSIGVPHEAEFPIGPLEEDEAAALFEERARRTRPDIITTPESMQNLARTLGGMPLALELAAARVGVQDLSQLESLEWTTEGDFGETLGIPKRQRSLDNVLKESLSLLSKESRDAFSKLGVFRGGFDTTAAKAVADASPRTLDNLRRCALIISSEEPDGSLRFRMPEPLRDVSVKENQAAHHGHAAYFADWIEANRADELPPPPYIFGLRLGLQAREKDNIRAALETCAQSADPQDREVGLRIVAAYWTHWYVRNESPDMERWAKTLLMGPGAQVDPFVQATASLSLALAVRERGAREESAEIVARAVNALSKGPRNRNLAFALHLRGLTLSDLGLLKLADEAYQESEGIWTEIADMRNFAVTRHNRGMLAVELGDLTSAERLVGEAMELFRQQNSTYTAIGSSTIGRIRRAKGDFVGAIAALTEAAQIHHRLGYVRGWAQNEQDLALCAHTLGRIDEARTWAEGALASFRKIGDRHGEATALAALARITGENWHADEARLVMARHALPKVGELLEGLQSS